MNAYPAPKPALVAALAALLAEHGPNALNELVATQLLLDSRESAEADAVAALFGEGDDEFESREVELAERRAGWSTTP